MAYDEGVAERLREALESEARVVEKRMFGGIAFMVDGLAAFQQSPLRCPVPSRTKALHPV